MRKKDLAWNEIFSKTNILKYIQKNGVYEIEASTIKNLSKQEPRIICKNDTIEDLPKIFRKHNLNILAIKNGRYMIFKDENYKGFLTLPNYTKLSPTVLPYSKNKFQTLKINERTSEKKAFKFASANNLFAAYFDKKVTLFESVSDRFFCNPFTLILENRKFDVKSVQIEIDSLYEDLKNKQIYIFELKNTTAATFNLRQLYYPYQHFKSSCNTKPVTILVQFSNGIYYLTRVELTDNYYNYNIHETKAYVFENNIKKKEDLEGLLNQEIFNPQGIPTPQANDINKIFDLLKLFVSGKTIEKEDVTEFFKFDPRQTNYYTDSARYIDLINKQGKKFKLTQVGKQISKEPSFYKRRILISKQILKTPLFNDIMINVKQNSSFDKEYIIKRIMHYDAQIKSIITAKRRSSTIISWLKWIQKTIKQEVF